ncbi:centriole and centriolar satellite protein OFD1-like isoform X2 [Lineus longissimus]|uniref:centriole and centriolar satellite protein OFD1-like isoform X2 n=1 Tax=Lineus longissimus TaxID=88925 RepID=UPI00315DAA08
MLTLACANSPDSSANLSTQKMWKNCDPDPEAEFRLGAHEFKNRLFSKLKEKGHVDALKAQLRSCLVDELQKSNLSLPLEPKNFGDEKSLIFWAANSLVADHLKRCNFEYALSVFLPESGTAHDQVFPVRDLLQLLHIAPQSKLYKKLTEGVSDNHMKGFLWQLLSEIAIEHAYTDGGHEGQADITPLDPISSLDEKLTDVDQQYSAKKDEVHHSGGLAMEERILSYQKQLEDRSNMHIRMEISRFKENELARVTVKEREKCRKEQEDLRMEMERAYQAKVSSLSARERYAIERLQKQQDGQEKEVYIQRQSILEEIETIRQRETQIKKDMQVSERERKLNEDKFRVTDELLRKRENAVKRLEDHFEKKLDEEMARFKLEERAKYVHRLKELEVREARNQEDLKIISVEKESLRSLCEKQQEMTMQVNELEMADYKYLKEENAVLKKELETMKLRLAEVSIENETEKKKQDVLVKEMFNRNGKPEPESLLMHHEGEETHDAVKSGKMMAECVQREVEKRLQQEISSSKQILKKFENQMLLQQQMQREIMEPRHQLIQTHHGLNKASRIPMRNRVMSQSEKESNVMYNDRPTSPDDYFDTSLGKSSPEPELMLLGDKIKHQEFIVGDLEDDNFIHEMKNRLQDLEKEAETLEASYHSFQARMSKIHTDLPMESVTTTASKYNVVFADTVANSLGIMMNSASRMPPCRTHGDQGTRTDSSKSSACINLLPSFGLSNVGHNDQTVMTVQDNTMISLPVPHRRKIMTVNDLDARPGSPSLVVVPGSQTTDTYSSQPTNSFRPEIDGAANQDVSLSDFKTPLRSQSPECVSVPETPPSNGQLSTLEDVWKSQHVLMAVSLDDTWKQETAHEMQKRESEGRPLHKEAVEANLEEQRRHYEEGKEKRDEEQRERERLELEKLKKTVQAQNTSELLPLTQLQSAKSSVATDEPNNDKEQIDPLMQKYMEMVKQQKEKEMKVVKKTVYTWKKDVPETTPSGSEQELSVAEDKKGHADDSDQFEW